MSDPVLLALISALSAIALAFLARKPAIDLDELVDQLREEHADLAAIKK